MSFKLTNASITFKTYIDKAVKEFIDIIYIISLNNILIFNENSTKYRRHMQQILDRFKDF